MSEKQLTIQEAADFLSVSTKTLRRWEGRGILIPMRTPGNQRRYTEQQLIAFQERAQNAIPQQLPVTSTIPARAVAIDKDSLVSKFVQVRHIFFPDAKTSVFALIGLGFLSVLGIFTVALVQADLSRATSLGNALERASLSFRNVSGNLHDSINPDDPFLAASGKTVLAATKYDPKFIFKVNIPSTFTSTVELTESLKVAKLATFAADITAPNVIYSLTAGTGIAVSTGQNPVITNTGVTSFQGQTGALTLTAGEGISLSGTTISNTQKIFQNVKVGGDTLTAGSATDTLTFAAGSGISLSTDTTNKKITITNNGSSPGWVDDGTVLRLETASDFVGIGTTNPSSFKLQVAGDVGPDADETYDLGSATLQWRDMYVGRNLYLDGSLVTPGSLINFWQRNAGAVSPTNITDDLLIGGTATASALFRISGETGYITMGSDTVGDFTGNGLSLSSNALGINLLTTADGTGGSSSQSGLEFQGAGNNQLTLLQGCNDNQLLKWDNTNNVWTCANDLGGGTAVVNVQEGSGTTYTGIDTLQFNENDFDISQAGTTSIVRLDAGLGRFNQAAGTLYASNTTQDLLIGGTATSSAKFAFINVSQGVPTASISAGVSGATFISANGNIQTTARQSLTLGGGDTGSIVFSGFGTGVIQSNASGVLSSAAINLAGGSSIVTGTLPVGNGGTGAASFTSNGVIFGNNTGALGVTAAGTNGQILIGVSGGAPVFATVSSDATISNTGVFTIADNAVDGTDIALGSDAAGDLMYYNGTDWTRLAIGSSGQLLAVNGSNDAPEWISTSSLNYWQRVAGTVSPLNITDDLLVGGNATSSAKFQIFGLSGNATTSGTLTFDTAGQIQTTENQTLTLGGNSTGNIILSPLNGAGSVSLGAGNISLSGTTIGLTTDTDLLSLASGALTINGTLSTSGTIEGPTINATTGINTGAAGGTQRIDNNGNLVNIGTTEFNNVTYTWPGADGSNGAILTTNGSGALSWASTSSINFWQRNDGALSPLDITNDLLLGATGTSSAKIALFNIASGTPTASISANTPNNAAYLTGLGNLATTNMQTLTLGGTSTGNIVIDSGAGFITLNDGTTINSTLAVTGAITGATATNTINGIVINAGVISSATWQGSAIAAQYGGTGDNTSGTTGVPYISSGDWNYEAALSALRGGTGANLSGAAQGAVPYFSATGVMSALAPTTAGYVLTTNGVNQNPSWTDPATLGTNYWNRSNGVLSPMIASVHDLLLGSSATDSAKIALININSGTPTASISGNTANNAAFLTGLGNLGTTNAQTLMLGGSTTGNIVLDSGSGSIILSDAVSASGLISANAGLTIASGQNLTIAGYTSKNSVLYATETTGVVAAATTNTASQCLMSGASGPAWSACPGSGSGASKFTLTGDIIYPNVISNQLGIGTMTDTDVTSSLFVTRNLASGALGSALAIFDQTEDQDVLTASASGTTVFTIGRNGAVTLTGNLALSGDASEGISGGGLTDCDGAASKLIWDASTNKFGCGADAGAGSGSSKWTESGTVLYPNTLANQIGIGTQTAGDVISSFYVSRSTSSPALGKALAIFNQTEAQDILTASASGVAKFTVDRNGNLGIAGSNPSTSNYITASNFVLETDGTISTGIWEGTAIGGAFGGTGLDTTGLTGVATVSNGTWSISSALSNALGGTGDDTSATTGVPYIAAGNWQYEAALSSARGGTGADLSAATQGSLPYFSSTGGVMTTLAPGTSGYVLTTNGAGQNPSWTDATTLGTNYWDRANGVVSPKIAGVHDLLLGSNATESAKFAFINVNSGTPTASISAGVNGGIFLTATGNIRTTAGQSLTLGGGDTGNIVLSGFGQGVIQSNASGTLSSAALNLAGGANFITGILPVANGGTGANTLADLITLGTHTTGNYVQSITNGNGITGASSSEGAALTLSINLTSSGETATTSSNSGLELSGSGLSLLRGCTDGYVLKWDDDTDVWECAQDTGGLSSAVVNIEEGDATITSTADTIDFLGNDFILDEDPTGEVNISIDYANSNITRKNQTETIASAWTFSSAITAPTATDTINGLVINAGVLTSATWNGNVIGAIYGGTGQNDVVTGDLLFGSAADTWSRLSIGAPGQILSVSGGNVPEWISTTSLNYWQRAEGSLAPLNITDDLLLGATGTASAKIALINIASGTPTASISANTANNAAFLTGLGNLGTTNMQTLTLGGSSTGNIVLDSGAGSIVLSDAVSASGLISANAGLSIASGQNLTIAGYTSKNSVLFATETTGVVAAATTNTASQCLLSGASGPAWGACPGSGSGASKWTLSNSVLYPNNIGEQIGIGTTTEGDVISSLYVTRNLASGALGKSLAIFNQTEQQDILTASASGTTRFTVDRTGNVNIIGGAYNIGGASVLSSTSLGASVVSSSLTSVGTIATGVWNGTSIAGAYGGTGIDTTSLTGIATVSNGTWSIASALSPTLGGTGDNTSATTGVPYISAGNWLYEAALSSARGGTGADLSGATQGSVPYFSATGVMSALAPTTAGYVLTTNGAGQNPTWTDPSNVGTNYWDRANGVLSPKIAGVHDLLLGSSATDSAKIALININSGTPTASISGNTANNAAFLTGLGNLGTTNMQTLTLGGSSTGNIVLDSGSGSIVLSDAVSASGLISANAGLTIASGQNLTIAGYTAKNSVLYATETTGVVSAATTNTASQCLLSGASGPAWGACPGSGSGASKWTLSGTVLYPNAIGEQLGIGTQTAGDVTSSFYVTRNLASGALGKALAVFNQTEDQDIITASASGTTVFTLNKDGNLDTAGTLTAGTANAFTVSATGVITTVTDETINGIDISAGVISDATWQGAAIADAYIADTLTIDSSSSVHWTALNNYPTGCNAGDAVTAVGDTLTCSTFLTAESDGVIGNEVTNATNATLTRSGAGTGGDPYTLALNLSNANTWTGLQSFNAGFTATGARTGQALAQLNETGDQAIFVASSAGTTRFVINNAGNVGIGTNSPSTKLSIAQTYNANLSSTQQNITSHAMHIQGEYGSGGFHQPGIVWSTSDNNPTKPKAAIWTAANAGGSSMFFGTSNGYATGVTNTALVIDEAGKVSVGAGGPAVAFHVRGAADVITTEIMRIEGTGSYGTLAFLESSTLQGYFGYGNDGHIFTGAGTDSFSIRATNALHLGGSGNNLTLTLVNSKAGIGTASPDSKLHVTGAVTGKALAMFNETGDQDILVASKSGTTRFAIGNNGNITATSLNGTDLFSFQTGSMQIGNGTPDLTLNGEDLYVEGTFEADGAVRFDNSTITLSSFNGTNAVLYGTETTGVLASATTASTGLCLTSGASAPTWSACPGSGSGASKWTLSGEVLYPNTISNQLGIGTTTAGDVNSSLYVTRDLASGALGKALAIFNQTEDQDVLTASASGTTVFTIGRNGAVTLTGNLALSGDASEGISGGGLTDCDAASSKLIWDAATNKFGCGTDGGSGSGSSKWTESGTVLYPNTIANQLGIGTTTAGDVVSSFYLTRNLASGALGKSLAIFNQTEDQDIITASASGTTVFTLNKDGNLDTAGTLTAGTANAFTVSATGVISAVADETINGIDISAGVISDATWQGAAIADAYIADTLTIDSSSSVHWTALNNYPTGCDAGDAVTAVGDTLTCSTFLTAESDGVIGNEVTNATNATLTRSGAGTGGDPYTLALNLGNTNTWTALQSFNAGVFSQGARTGQALAIFDETGDQDILTASASGTTRFTIGNNGNLTATSLNGTDLFSFQTGSMQIGNAAPSVALNGEDLFVEGTFEADGAVRFDNSSITFSTFTGTNAVLYGTSTTGVLASATTGSTGLCLMSGASAPAWGACPGSGSGSSKWTEANGTLSPNYATVMDLLLGGTATASAKFAVLNMNSGTPTASISANSGDNALFLTGTGNIATTNMQNLVIGGDTTGSITLNPTSGIILGGASADTITANAATWTFANDTNFALSGGVNGLSFDTNTLSIDASNNRIGIGTTAPERKLVLYESSSSNSDMLFQNATTGSTVADGFLVGLAGDESAGLWNYENTHMTLATNSIERITIAADGRVGIGETSPTGLLHLKGAVTGKALSILDETGDQDIFTASASGTTVANITRSGTLQLSDGSTGTPSFTFLNDTDTGMYRVTDNTIGFAAGGAGELGLSGSMLYPITAEGLTLGGTSNEFDALYLGDNEGAYFGLDQDFHLAYDEASDDRLELTATNKDFYMGLGTGKLHVVGTSTQLRLGYDTTNYTNFTIDSAGKLTIAPNGTTAATFSSVQNTFDLPTAFTSTGDVEFAYDANFSNTTAAYINFEGPGYIRTTHPSADNDLTLSAANNGNIIMETSTLGGVQVGTDTQIGKFQVSGAKTGKALTVFNETGNQDILTASASGTTRFTIGNNGNITATSANGTDLFNFLTGSMKIGNGTPDVTLNGEDLYVEGTLETDGAVRFDNSSITLSTFTGTNAVLFGTSGTGVLASATTGSTGLCLMSGASAPAWGACPGSGSGSSKWTEANGTLSPNYASVMDLLIGGSATSSAKFQVFGTTGNASTSGTLTFNGAGTNYVNTLGGQALTFRTSPGGDAGLANRLTILANGNVGIGDTTPDGLLDLDTAATSGTIFGITSTGIQTAGDIFNITADSVTTADIVDISAKGLTTGSALTISGPLSGSLTNAGNLISLTSNVTSGAELLYLAPNFTGASTAYGINLNGTNSHNEYNISYGANIYLDLSGTGNKEAYGVYVDITSTATGGDVLTGGTFNALANGSISSGNKDVTGVFGYARAQNSSGTTTSSVYGGRFQGVGETGGTGTAYGIYSEVGGGDTNYGIYIDTLAAGANNYALYSAAAAQSYFAGNVGIGTTAPTTKLHVSGATTGQALTLLNETGDQDIFTASASGTTRFTIGNNGNLTANSLNGTDLFSFQTGSMQIGNAAPSVALNGEDLFVEGTFEADGAVRFDNSSITLSSFNGTNAVLFGTETTGVLAAATTGSTGLCLVSGASAPSWDTCPGGSGGSNWTAANGTLSPNIATVMDLLLGGTATSSAKFAVLNMNSGTPTASISANSGDNALFLTGTGNIATTNMQNLVIGGDTTGSITLNPTSGIILGGASTDTITANAATWTFANDTNFALTGGLNGLSFDTDTLSIDALNNRIGIGTTAPAQQLEIHTAAAGGGLALSYTDSGTSYAAVNFRDTTSGNEKWSFGVNADSYGSAYENNAFYIFQTRDTAESLVEQYRLVITDYGTMGIGTAAPDAKLHLAGFTTGKALSIFDEQGDQNILTASASGTTVFNLTRAGMLEAADLTLGLNDATATISTYDTDEALTLNPNGTGAVYFHGSTYNMAASGSMTIGSRITFGNAEYIDNSTNGDFIFSGTGGSNNTDIRFDLDNADGPLLSSITSSNIVFDDNFQLLGSKQIATTNNGTLTFIPHGTGDFSFTTDSDSGVGIGVAAPTSTLHVSGASTGKALAIFDDTGTDQNVLTASASGTTVLNITRSGNVQSGGGSDTSPAYTFIGDTDTGMYRSAANTVDFTSGGVRSLSLGTTASGINAFKMSPGATGAGPTLTAVSTGADTNIDLNFSALGTGSLKFNSGVTTGTTTSSGFAFNANSLTSGTGMYVGTTNTGLTTGSLFQVASTANFTNFSGNIANIDWSPTVNTTATGDLLRISLGSSGNIGNLFNILDSGSSLFSVSESQITSAIPHQFTTAGDVAIAYDLVMTNQTAGYIKSYGPLTIETGESFESNNMTLKTFNAGNIILDTAATGGVQIGTDPQIAKFQVSGAKTGKALVLFNQTGNQDILTASVSGSTKMVLDNNGDLGLGISSPAYRLHVNDSQAASAAAMINNTSTGANPVGLIVKMGYTATSGNTANHYIDFLDGNGNQRGNIRANGSDGIELRTAGIADFAEYIKKDENENIPFGSLMCISDHDKVTSCNNSSQTIIGVASKNPTVSGGIEDGNRTIPVGLVGIVETLVSTANGTITAGDFITVSSEKGIGVKATKAGQIVGKALFNYSGSGTGKIHVLVQPGWYDPDVKLTTTGDINMFANPSSPSESYTLTKDGKQIDRVGLFSEAAIANLSAGAVNAQQIKINGVDILDLLSQATSSTSGTLSASTSADLTGITNDVNELSDKVNAHESRLLDVETMAAQTASDAAFLKTMLDMSVLSASTEASLIQTLEELDVKIATVSGTLNVLGRTTLGDLGVTGNITAGIMSIHGLDGEINTLGAPLKIQSYGFENIEFIKGDIVMDTDGNIELKKGRIIGNDTMRGQETLTASTTSIVVTQDWDIAPKSIVLTPSYNTTAWVENITVNGFTIKVSTPSTTAKKVYWMAIW